MTTITVELEIPEWVATGLGDGTLERIGGVVRNRSGKKSVRAWLLDTGGAGSEQGSRILQSLDMLGPALQITNMAVTAVGFAMVLHRLGELDRKLDEVVDRLQAIGRDVRWTRDVIDRDLIARVRGAVTKLRLNAFADPASSRLILGDLIDIAESLDGRRMLLLEREEAYEEPGVFGVYSEYLTVCIQVQGALAWRLGPPGEAATLMDDWSRRLSAAARRLEDPIRAAIADPTRPSRLALLEERHRINTARNLHALRTAADEIEVQGALIRACDTSGLTADDVTALGAQHADKIMLISLEGAVHPRQLT